MNSAHTPTPPPPPLPVFLPHHHSPASLEGQMIPGGSRNIPTDPLAPRPQPRFAVPVPWPLHPPTPLPPGVYVWHNFDVPTCNRLQQLLCALHVFRDQALSGQQGPDVVDQPVGLLGPLLVQLMCCGQHGDCSLAMLHLRLLGLHTHKWGANQHHHGSQMDSV